MRMTVYSRNMQQNLMLIAVIDMRAEPFVIFVYIYGLHSSHIHNVFIFPFGSSNYELLRLGK